jgi:hypothetical protein
MLRGGEFARLHRLGLPVYACRPCAAWEQGMVEQQNGVLRISAALDGPARAGSGGARRQSQ